MDEPMKVVKEVWHKMWDKPSSPTPISLLANQLRMTQQIQRQQWANNAYEEQDGDGRDS